MSDAISAAKAPRGANGAGSSLVKRYLLLYNATSFCLWGYLLCSVARFIVSRASTTDRLDARIPGFYETIFPILLWTQTLACLEALHCLLGFVRASFVTTLMQVASRLFVVWLVLFAFGGRTGYFVAGGDAQSLLIEEKGGAAFLGCLTAWAITECVRYAFFCCQVSGKQVPGLLRWLRYNMFFVLYPIGIASECSLTCIALRPARQVHSLLHHLFFVVLLVYVPGSYILYAHMMAQRRKVMRAHLKAQ